MIAQTFWSGTFTEWAGLITGTVLFLVAVGGLLIKMGRDREASARDIKELRADMLEKFTEQGRRIGAAETNCSTHGSSIEDLKRLHVTVNLELGTNSREVARLAGQVDTLEADLNRRATAGNEIEKIIRERLAVIETKLHLRGPERER